MLPMSGEIQKILHDFDAHKKVLKYYIRNCNMLTKGSRNFRDEISKRQESRSRTSLSQKVFWIGRWTIIYTLPIVITMI